MMCEYIINLLLGAVQAAIKQVKIYSRIPVIPIYFQLTVKKLRFE